MNLQRRDIGFLSCVSIVVLAACSSTSDGRTNGDPVQAERGSIIDLHLEGHPWADEFRRAYVEANTDFVRAMLSDGQLDRREMVEAMHKFVQCMNNDGLPVEFMEWGEVFGFGSTDPTWDRSSSDNRAIEISCQDLWLGSTWELWEMTQSNPDNLTQPEIDDLIARCLVGKGLAPSGLTGLEYRNIVDKVGEEIAIDELDIDMLELQEYLIQRAPTFTFADGTEIWFGDERVYSCQIDPTQLLE